MTNKFFPEALFELGYHDLIPVIPPGAQLTPSSKITPALIGKIPGLRKANGLWSGFDWRRHVTTAADVKQWCIDGANIGLRADRFPAVDIDCTDPVLVKIIADVARAKLGSTPMRTGKAPKQLLIYQLAGGAEAFGRMRLWIERGGEHHLVEVLAQGQQYLVHGTHPSTLQPYRWDTDLLSEIPPMIDRELASAFLDELQSTIEMLGAGKVEREGDGRPSQRTDGGDQDSLKAPSLEVLREAVRSIPNTNELFPDRTSYLKIGYAIRAAGVEDLDEAFNIFAEWAERWEGNGRSAGNDPGVVLSDWRRMRGPYSVGWNFLAEQARAFGFNDASLEFDAVEEQPRATDEGALSAPRISDQWLADKVVARQRGRLRYVPERGCYMVWDSSRWRQDAELLAEDLIKRELRVVADEVARVGATDKEKRESLQQAVQICSAGKVSAVASLIRSDRAVAVALGSLDHDPWILNTPSGIVDLRAGSVSAADPDALCSKSTAAPADFDADCPRWKQFLDEATGGDQEVVAYLKRLCGYSLTGSTREQHLTFIYGPGGNGKGVFLNTVSGVLGDYGRTATMDTFTASHGDKHSTDVAMLVGARLVTASETAAGKRWDEQRVKGLTGGDPVTARFMRQDNFTYTPHFKLVFVGNHKPEIRAVDDAMKRRIQIVPFTVKPVRIDHDLGAKLREEWPAILAWMIEGCLEWQDGGLQPPERVKLATTEYFEEEDAYGKWLSERCTKFDSATAFTLDLFQSYTEWANQNKEYVGSAKRLATALTSRGYERWQDPESRRKGFRGIRINERQGADLLS